MKCIFQMLRRDPTRIEFKHDDIHEFENLRKEQEQKNKNSANMVIDEPSTSHQQPSKTEKIHSRIGFDPTPKPS